jgi:hypothetical protein
MTTAHSFNLLRKNTMTDSFFDSVKEDPRTADELYQDVVYQIQRMYNFQLTDTEAHEAARNVLGFFQTVIEIRTRMNH